VSSFNGAVNVCGGDLKLVKEFVNTPPPPCYTILISDMTLLTQVLMEGENDVMNSMFFLLYLTVLKQQ
jgi:hypothetical protein